MFGKRKSTICTGGDLWLGGFAQSLWFCSFLWLLGFSLHIAGNLIFLLLLLAIVGVIYNLLAGGGRRHVHTTEVTAVERYDG